MRRRPSSRRCSISVALARWRAFGPRRRAVRRPGRRTARRRSPNALQRAKATEIERLKEEGRARIAGLSERELLVAGVALYAGEGSKRDGDVRFANSDPRMIAFFCAWLRRFFDVDERRLRVRIYLHQGLDLDEAERFWSALTGVPRTQFGKAYRAVPDAGIRPQQAPPRLPQRRLCERVRVPSDQGPHRGTASLAYSFRGSSIGGAGDC